MVSSTAFVVRRVAALPTAVLLGLLPVRAQCATVWCTAGWLPLAPVQIDPTLPGVTFYLQIAEIEFSAGWVGTCPTNGLTCTAGAF